MAARRGNRKSPRKTKKTGGSAGMLPWIAVATVLAIVGYDHWSSIKPELASVARVATSETAPVMAAVARPTIPAPQARPVVKSGDSAILPPAPVPVSAPASAAAPSTAPLSGALSESFGLCGQGTHINCVFDGSTFWVKGAKIRIADIQTPTAESSHCAGEVQRANAAKLRLLSLLNAGPFFLQGAADGGQDGARQGRVVRNGQSFGDLLVNEGLARRSTDRAVSWCA